MTTETTAWPIFEAALLDRELVAERTMSFRWQKPADWDYQAGQFIDITLHEPPETDAEGDTRGFSISSAPCEDIIQITTRLHGGWIGQGHRRTPSQRCLKPRC